MSTAKPSWRDRLSYQALRILPHHPLSALMYRIARCETPWFKDAIIHYVMRAYDVDLADAIEPNPDAYPSFNAFFTRALDADARPIAEEAVVSPVDGRISQMGRIKGQQLLQAKGHDFELTALLGGDRQTAATFIDGEFATIYLSPRDYHRIHMPVAGELRSMHFIPGRLFSVSDATTQMVPNLFARNERLICHFDTRLGPLAVIFVGAIFVGSMQTVWAGEIRSNGDITRRVYVGDERRHFAAGDEIGRFNMGSTVIMLLPQGSIEWEKGIAAGKAVKMGDSIAAPVPRAAL